MKKYSFRELVVDARTGLNPRKNFTLGNGSNYYITIKDIHDGKIIITDKTDRINDEAIAMIKKRSRIKNGDILFTSIGRIGETAIVIDKNDTWDVNESVFIFTLDTKIITQEYFCALMLSKSVQDKLQRDSSGSTFKSIKMNQLEKMEFFIPSVDVQIEITQKLNQIKELILARQEQIALHDDLIKSRFIEMFGDPILNPYNWNIVNITEVVGGKVTNGFFAKRDEYTENGNVKVLGVANIVNRMYSNVADLPRTNGTASDIQKFEVRYGDMLFCRSSLVAEGIGKASIVPHDVPPKTLFECHVIRLPLDLNKCVPEFMQVLSTTDYFRNQVIAQSKTATMTTIGQDGILKTMIILPPIEKQKQFLDFVKQTDKSKFEIQKSLEQLEILKKSLMQKYFG